MEKLFIPGTAKTPTLIFDGDKGIIEIFGRSYPEHAIEVYKEANDWLNEYAKSPKPETLVKVSLEYFNTSSSKVVLDIMRKVEALHLAGKKVNVEWYYENDDDDMKDQGEIYQSIMKVPIKLIGIEEFKF